jgi:HEPN domain-containing protein
VDIYRQGIILYSRKKFRIDIDIESDLPLKEFKKLSEGYLDRYSKKISTNIKIYNFLISEGDTESLNKAAFELHQLTENLFHCLLLVHNTYSPKEHNLSVLLDDWISKKIENSVFREIQKIFPQDSEAEKNLWKLLVKSYVDARYERNFSISSKELKELFSRILQVKDIVESACEGFIEGLRERGE